jgi:hypothetical protein
MPLKKDDIIQPINATLDAVTEKLVARAPLKHKENNALTRKNATLRAPPAQSVLDLGIETQKTVNGVEMGVLENGIPFLTQSGLAKLAGAKRGQIYAITQEWEAHYDDDVLAKGRISFLRDYLFKNGYTERKLFIETKKDGSVHYAYPDIVCMAVLEYYAFEASGDNQREAQENYRRLAAYGLQRFIYDGLNYTPADPWKMYHARVSLLQGSAPAGYFIVFHEIAPMIVDLINSGLTVNDHTVPDGSVGGCWGRFWEENSLDATFGERIKYPHFFPPEFPQSKSNPQMAWAYPDTALAEFRKWFRAEYLITKFPKYILTKAHVLGGQDKAKQIGTMYQPKQIGSAPT